MLQKGRTTIDECPNGKVVKYFSAVLPGIGDAILPVDLILKSVNSSDLSGLVVASQESDSIRVFDLQAEQVLESLYRVIAPIHEISDEDVAGMINISA